MVRLKWDEEKKKGKSRKSSQKGATQTCSIAPSGRCNRIIIIREAAVARIHCVFGVIFFHSIFKWPSGVHGTLTPVYGDDHPGPPADVKLDG